MWRILKHKIKSCDAKQGLSQDLEAICPKLAIVKFCSVLFFKGEQNILRLQK